MFTKQNRKRAFLVSITVIILLALILGACAASRGPETAPRPASVNEMVVDKIALGAPAMDSSNAVQSAVMPEQAAQVERVVIKNANMTLVVTSPGDSMNKVTKLAESMGGYVVSANLYKEELSNGIKVPHASITIRVPAEKLNDALLQIRQESDQEPISQAINSEDITQQYIDLQSRLRNLENYQEQLSELMGSAKTTEDALAGYNQLAQVNEQIEVLKGQIKYYDEAAKLSAVSVELLANEAVQPLTIGGWQPGGVVKSSIQALINAFKFIVNFLIRLIIVVLPILLIIFVIFVLPIWFIVRAVRRRTQHKKASPPDEPTQ